MRWFRVKIVGWRRWNLFMRIGFKCLKNGWKRCFFIVYYLIENWSKSRFLAVLASLNGKIGKIGQFCPIFTFLKKGEMASQKALKIAQNALFIDVFVIIWQICDFLRIAQIGRFRARVGCAGKNRKEIELSTQKIKNGNLPTDYSALRTAFDLRSKTRGRGWK